MKNDYEIRGEFTVIFIQRRDGARIETLINTSDLEKVKTYPYTWCVKWDSHVNSYYVCGLKKKTDGKNTGIRLHRFILDDPKGKVIDHINHDTLNNTRQNLRIITNAQNQQNKRIKRSNTTSGVMGISYHQHSKRWKASLKVNGKTSYLGYYDDVKEAEKEIIKARKNLMPFSKEAENFNELNHTGEELQKYIQYRKNKKISDRKSKSKYLGVHWNKSSQRWRSYLLKDGNKTYLGSFKNKEDAINAVNKAREEVKEAL